MRLLGYIWFYVQCVLLVSPFILFWILPEIRVWLFVVMVISFVTGFMMFKYTPKRIDDEIYEINHKGIPEEHRPPR